MIELGGHIKLEGFHELEPAKLIVIKKIVGNYAKKMSEDLSEFSELLLEMKQQEEQFELTTTITAAGRNSTATTSSENLFIAMDNALRSALEQAKQ